MTNGEKATKLLSWLDEQDTKTVIQILHPMCSDGDLADEYDRLIEYGEISEEKQKANLIAFYDESYECWETLAEVYKSKPLSEFAEYAQTHFPEIKRDDVQAEIEGEIYAENARYVLTWDDSICECVRIYEKV